MQGHARSFWSSVRRSTIDIDRGHIVASHGLGRYRGIHGSIVSHRMDLKQKTRGRGGEASMLAPEQLQNTSNS